MTFVADLFVGKEAVSVMADLAKLLEVARHDPDQTLRTTINTLRSKAADSADRLSRQINGLMTDLVGLRVNLNLPVQNVGNGLGYGLDLPKRALLQWRLRKFREIQDSVRGFSDDVEQLLICARHTVDDLATSTYNVRTEMARMTIDNVPLEEQLRYMVKTIEDIGKSLREL